MRLLFDSTERLRHPWDAITQAVGASVGNRLNQVMKIVTILTRIVTPLTFITGIDGVNFEPMPELRGHDGFALILAAMLLVNALQA